jgi:hypothetical protein
MKILELFEDVWHGTPYNIDKFDLSRVGTGEGVSAYGWGLYFADKKEVAQYYQKSVKDDRASPRRFFKGQELTPKTPAYHAATLMSAKNVTLPYVKKEVQGWIKTARPEELEHFKGVMDTLNQATSKKDFTQKEAQGNIYQVQIPDDANYLLWDKPIMEQSPMVKSIMEKFLPMIGDFVTALDADRTTRHYDEENMETMSGAGFYYALSVKLKSQKAASLALHDAGIVGCKYLNGDSRTKGKGGYNYVIYDENAAVIKGKSSN